MKYTEAGSSQKQFLFLLEENKKHHCLWTIHQQGNFSIYSF